MSSAESTDRPPDVTGPGAAGLLGRTHALDPRQRRHLKASETLAQDLAAYIVDSNLGPGTALPAERQMLEQLGVGRTTLREALRLLETRGVLTIRSGPGGGPVVRRPKLEDLSESLSLMLQYAGASLTDVIEARVWLESAIARAAADRITPKQIVQLRAINDRLREEGLDDEAAFATGNDAFHRLVAEASGNLVLSIFLAALQSIADGRAAGIRYDRRFRAAAVDDHVRILDALAVGDAGAADRAARQHITAATRHWKHEHADLAARTVRWVL
jgi:DNA-binding FadR family transcriptional regulator